ncbi:hypothetical protein L6164_007326 [Bauhinia variegata]|uniref:Uncharacterized protein n=1 Tax=Bauhinia variegata TaxID=167791 RepID=A0ACB9PIQ8_BAUVA|nr:hypothetical protein L6164_007326 [Bauhinia variegata]
MAESTQIAIKQDTNKESFNLFSLLPKFDFKLPNLNLQIPFLKPDSTKVGASGEEEAKPNAVFGDEGCPDEIPRPEFVIFPEKGLIAPPPLETEAENQSNRTSNPIILWQVYALGGFIVLKWVWARWNERRAKGKSLDDDENGRGRSSGDSQP